MAPASARAQTLFDTGYAGSTDFAMFPFWQRVLDDVGRPLRTGLIPAAFTSDDLAQPQQPAAPCADERHCAPAQWLGFLDSLRGQSPTAQMTAVNRWANGQPYVEDAVNWSVPNYWETPGEFLARGGDCKDYAVTKYFSLVRLGFAPEDLRIVVVSDSATHVFHAVLAVQQGGKVWLLDNQRTDVVEMTTATEYTPIYSLNQQGWWLHSNPTIRFGGLTIAAGPLPSQRDAQLTE